MLPTDRGRTRTRVTILPGEKPFRFGREVELRRAGKVEPALLQFIANDVYWLAPIDHD